MIAGILHKLLTYNVLCVAVNWAVSERTMSASESDLDVFLQNRLL